MRENGSEIMKLTTIRKRGAGVAVATIFTFGATTLRHGVARADMSDATAPINGSGGAPTMTMPQTAPSSVEGAATVDLSTGAATASFPFQLETARGDAQPALALSYNSSNSIGVAGVGWTISMPTIVRKGTAGMPQFADPILSSTPDITADDYYIDGKLLVPICKVNGTACQSGGRAGEVFPSSVSGSVYFRTESDDEVRYFFDGLNWSAQTKAGHTLLFGDKDLIDLSTEIAISLVPTPHSGPANVAYSWHLSSDTDVSGNRVLYKWTPTSGMIPAPGGPDRNGKGYLTDIYDTESTPGVFAHHVHLRYQNRFAPFNPTSKAFATSPIWREVPTVHLVGVDVTSATFASATRQMVRRYNIDYTGNGYTTRDLLTGISLEGTCMTGHGVPATITEDGNGLLPTDSGGGSTTSCPILGEAPLVQYGYTPEASLVLAPGPTQSDPQAWNPTVLGGTSAANSIPYALVDVDGDGASDFVWESGSVLKISTAPNGPAIALDESTLPLSPNGSLLPRPRGPLGSVFGDWLSGGNIAWLDPSGSSYLLVTPSTTGISETPTPGTAGLAIKNYSWSVPKFTIANAAFGSPVGPFDPLKDLSFVGAPWGLDLDGDGLTDTALFVAEMSTGPEFAGFSTLTRRDRTGATDPFTSPALMGVSDMLHIDCHTFGSQVASCAGRVFSDMDGDGLTDLVLPINKSDGLVHLHVLTNRGNGSFGGDLDGNGASGYDLIGGSGGDTWTINASATLPGAVTQTSPLAIGDLNGDGLADYVLANGAGFQVCIRRNDGIADFLCSQLAYNDPRLNFPSAPKQVFVQIADVDGSGVAQALVWADTQMAAVRMVSSTAPRPGLLNAITTQNGLSTTLHYQYLKNLGLGPKVPVAAWAVTDTTTSNGLTGLAARSDTVSYTYTGPVYDRRDRVFVGFQTVQESHSDGGTGGPGLVRSTGFMTLTCTTDCVGSVDYSSYRMLRGLPVFVEESGTNGMAASSTLMQYGRTVEYNGLDGRTVTLQRPFTMTTFIGDGQSPQIYAGPWYPIAGNNSIQGAQFRPSTFTMVTRGFGYDSAGNLNESWVGGTGGPTVATLQSWALPSGDTSGWNYRVVQAQTGVPFSTPSSFPPFTFVLQQPRSATTIAGPRTYNYNYDASGRLISVQAPRGLTNQLVGPGFNVANFAAGQPPDASGPTITLLSNVVYDPNGNVVQIQWANNRCKGIGYDPVFAQLPIAEVSHLDGCNGTSSMATSLTWDRGWERVTMSTNPSLLTGPASQPQTSPPPHRTYRLYDSFARLIEVDQPDPTTPGIADIAMEVGYVDGGPIRRVQVQTADGPYAGITPGTWVNHFMYLDGFGDTLARLDFDQVTASGTTQYIVSGRHQLFPSGLVAGATKPYAYASATAPDDFLNPSQYNATTGPQESFTYDAAGRVLTSTDLNSNTTTWSYQVNPGDGTALTATVVDPEQVSSGLHPGSFTSFGSDFLGREIKTTRHLNAGPGGSPADVVTTIKYEPTGEPFAISQTNPGGAAYTRTLTHDAIGRLAWQGEPNTGRLVNGQPISWVYAWNDNNELVGLSDNRGCGEVIYHDALGRLAGEDYSPCDPGNQPTHSPATLVSGVPTGYGTETFYQYDAYGRTQVVSDRAEQSTYAYDERDRPVTIGRQLAVPSSADPNDLTERYSSQQFTKSIAQYSEANHVLVETTGASAPELLVNGASSLVATYSARGLLTSLAGSYGTLIKSQTFDAMGAATSRVYGDAAATQLSSGYYPDETLSAYRASRLFYSGARTYTQGGPPPTPPPGQPNPTVQGMLTNERISVDKVDNPTSIVDGSAGTQWPAGAEPAKTRGLTYGDDYRLIKATTDYASASADDQFQSPYTPADAPFLPAVNSVPNRVRWQTFTYDGRGNVTSSADDSNSGSGDFCDRSLGTATMVSGKGDQLSSATQGSSSLTAKYDVAGNLTAFRVTRPSGSTEYDYKWDEVGQLSSASRVDGSTVAVSEKFLYDASGGRVMAQNGTSYNINVFDTLVLKNTSFDGLKYVDDRTTETLYLLGVGRAFYDNAAPGTAGSLPIGAGSTDHDNGRVHIYLNIPDPLGSTSFVIDRDSGELVEHPTYLAYGGVESDYRPARWNSDREDARFTGQWDDAEVSLVYMNARYYSPQLGRFISPDPLTIHDLASDPNPYAYASGSPLRFTDPSGLGCGEGGCPPDMPSPPPPPPNEGGPTGDQGGVSGTPSPEGGIGFSISLAAIGAFIAGIFGSGGKAAAPTNGGSGNSPTPSPSPAPAPSGAPVYGHSPGAPTPPAYGGAPAGTPGGFASAPAPSGPGGSGSGGGQAPAGGGQGAGVSPVPWGTFVPTGAGLMPLLPPPPFAAVAKVSYSAKVGGLQYGASAIGWVDGYGHAGVKVGLSDKLSVAYKPGQGIGGLIGSVGFDSKPSWKVGFADVGSAGPGPTLIGFKLYGVGFEILGGGGSIDKNFPGGLLVGPTSEGFGIEFPAGTTSGTQFIWSP
jgi:RHS repeat-associated protein